MARVHGGIDPAEFETLGMSSDGILDFSVNVNPYGPSVGVIEAIRRARLDCYPDTKSLAARRALAARWGVSPDAIALGNGAAELLWTLVQRFVRGGGPLLVIEPTFCEPALAAAAIDAPVVSWRAGANSGFAVDGGAVAALAKQANAAAIYLCNPQNPTGQVLRADAVGKLASALGARPLILDEAFLSLSHAWQDASVPLPANVIRVRSFTKEHALPGLRVGALVGPPALVAAIESSRPAWTVSEPSQQAVIAASTDEGDKFVAGSRALLLADAAAFRQELRDSGFVALPSDTVYGLVDVGDAAVVRRRLLARHRLLVRDCSSFGLPQFLRIAARPAADRARLIEALRAERLAPGPSDRDTPP